MLVHLIAAVNRFLKNNNHYYLKIKTITTILHFLLENDNTCRFLVFDMWTTRCERCPAALDKLNKLADTYKDTVTFVSINADDKDFAEEIIEENDWEKLHHLYITTETKEKIKALSGLKSVPYYFIYQYSDNGCNCVMHGGPKDIDFDVLLPELVKNAGVQNENSCENNANCSNQKNVFTLDEDF